VAVVEIAIRRLVADIGDVAFDQRYQGDTRRQRDAAVRVQAVFDLQ
jgi:hypothetical protein